MIPSRNSGEQNPYWDKPPELLMEHYADLDKQSKQAHDFWLSLEAAKLGVLAAVAENTAAGITWESLADRTCEITKLSA